METDSSKKVIIDIDNNFGDIMIMALRYALGRRTYVTNEVPDFIKNNSDFTINPTWYKHKNKVLEEVKEND